MDPVTAATVAMAQAAVVQMWLTAALVAATIVLTGITGKYTRIANTALERTYETYVTVDQWERAYPQRVRLTNLGPGPARNLQVRAVHRLAGKNYYLIASIGGIAAGSSQDVPLADAEPFDWVHFSLEAAGGLESLATEITAETVRGKRMPPQTGVVLPLPITPFH